MAKTVSSVMLFLLLTSMLTLTLRTQPAKAADVDDWPMFHHDLSHTGASTSTGPTTSNIQWIYKTGGGVESSPAVVGGLVYIGSDDDNVYCLNAANGSLGWNYTTGNIVWSSPAVVGDLVYVGSEDDNVYCLNAANGSFVWSYKTGNAVYSSPAVVGGLVYIGSGDDNVYCLNAATGAFVWSYTITNAVESSPAVAGGLVYVGSNDDSIYCLNASTGALVWRNTTGDYVYSSPAVADGFVYIGSGDHNVYCLNATTGTFIWSYTTGNPNFVGGVESSPAVAGGLVYVGSWDYNVYCLNATTGAFVWSYQTKYTVNSSPAVAGGLVYIGSSYYNVYCLNAATGAFIWSYRTNSEVDSSPALVNGVAYIGSDDGNIYAFGPSAGLPTYSVSFSESGLPQGAQWSVTFNGQTQSSTSNSITFNVTNGVYAFSIMPPGGYTASPSSGSIAVRGVDVGKQISFAVGSNEAHSWPMFHYDLNRTGYSTSTASTTNNAIWTYTTPGGADSSAAVVGGLVYLGSIRVAGAFLYPDVYCLNAVTGSLVWTYMTDGSVESSPAVVGGLVYLGSDSGKVYCLSAATGTLIWSYTTGSYVGSSPAVADGFVYIGSDDGNVYCLNAATGTLVWNYTTGGEVHSSPAIVGGLVYVGSWDYNVYCLNATTGAFVWSYQTGGMVQSSPAVVGGLVYVGSWDYNVYCLNAANGARVWTYATSGPVGSSPAVADGFVYIGSGDHNVYCLNAATGTLVWNYTTGGGVESSPAVVGGLVYVGSADNNLYCLDAANGSFVWSYKTGNAVYSSPAVADGVVYVGSMDGNIYAFGSPYSPQTSSVSFSESGLAQGTQWNVTFNGQTQTSTSNTITFNVPNGLYAFSITPPTGYTASTSQASGSITVNGTDITNSITFSPSQAAVYTVTFTESGLVTGTEWSVTFNGITSGGSSNITTFYGVEDGSYSFTVGNVSGSVASPADESVTVASPSSGTITVNGANANQTITFQYTVTSWDPVKNSYNINNFGSIWASGDCYGLSSTALLYFTHYTLGDDTYPYFPSQDPQATSTVDLDIAAAQTTLNNATLAVMFHQVFGAPADNKLIPPPSASFPSEAEQFNYLIGNLTTGQPVVLILGTATGWPHAVVAWGAGTIGNGNLSGNIAIYLYDSNYPKTTKEAIIDPATDSFSYDVYSKFYVMDSVAVTNSLVDPHLYVGQPWWGTIWLGYMVTGYNIVVESRMVTIYSNGLKDYFTAAGDSQTFICGIPGTFGIEEGSMQVYAIPEYTPFSVSDPTSGQSTTFMTRVDNESGQLVGYGYLLDATAVQGDLNYTITPTASGLSINAGNNALDANVTFFTDTEQNNSISQASNIQVGVSQTANFTVSNWQTLNETGIQITTIPEFPGASGIILTLSTVLFVALVTVVRRRKNRQPEEARSN